MKSVPPTDASPADARRPDAAGEAEREAALQGPSAEPLTHPTGVIAELWLYIKYQLLTKPFLLFVIFPALGLVTEALMLSAGRRVLSSGDYLSFLFSWQGGVLVLLGVMVVVVTIATDISAFILMEAARLSRRAYPTAFQSLSAALVSTRLYLHPGTWLLVVYVAVVAPLGGVGLSVGIFKDFSLPNFITHVIYTTPLYLVLYGMLVAGLAALGFFLQFAFHFVVLEGRNPWQGTCASVRLVKGNLLPLISTIARAVRFIGMMLVLILLLTLCLFWAAEQVPFQGLRRFSTILALMVGGQLFSFLLLSSGPIFVRYLTDFFFLYRQPGPLNESLIDRVLAPPPMAFRGVLQRSRHPFRSLLRAGLMVLAVNSVTAVGSVWRFDEVFKPRDDIIVVAHRAGGDLGPENSLLGLEAAIRAGVAWAEIDVQRTADGAYVVNHDADFRRVSGVARRAEEVTLAEARQLTIEDAFDSTRPAGQVASLADFMQAARGRIGLFIELKGATADRQMVDDVARMIREYGMEQQAAILSLDYTLVQYAEAQYPELDNGYLYFFSIGNPSRLTGDFLVMEEREATAGNIDAIHKTGKRVVVWTVNRATSIERFLASGVDAIITDHPLRVKTAIEARQSREERELVLHTIFAR
ncbi:MAG: glycerophosphoryl diester phosphodiesterase membrane domain-containing protein [Lautropia sp.]|nr:glycerophosphoryl diester phosphodiesterase membrane domain-containing protein [Lautropia sp.]